MASTSYGTPSIKSNSTQWDVFLSFHGEDTRYKFTNFLYNDLNLHGLRPFRDDPELRTGEVISDALKEAIRNSKTYVVVFSEKYASSPWCLDELVEIYKCFEEEERLVIGVYYHVHPSVVRHQTESFEIAFKKHQTGRFSEIHFVLLTTPFNPLGDSMASTSYGTPSIKSNSTQWDVFLSFHGVDTRYKFTNFLYNDLNLHGLRPFRDDPELRTGEVISDALKEAIRNSKTYVVVFSENYASSPWCLEELVEIYKCYQEKKRLVIGVYYHVHPSVVRHQTGSFENAFKKHETGRFSDKIDQVNQWRRALKGVAQFSGHTISTESDGVDIINEIASVILQHVKPKTLHVADHYVARGKLRLIKNRIAVKLSSEKVKGRVIKIGLHGLGGVGKTTLAKALYNHLLESNFDASCFLADVREAFGRPNGLVSLQNQLISAFVKSKTKDEVHNEDQGTEFIKQRFGLTKVVLVIDDIDNTEQCNSLMGPFAPGSVVIITTRDTAILDKIQVKSSHQFEVTVMKDAESLKLFTAHAFPNAKPDNNLMKLFQDDILGLAGNLPLALTVYGSHLSTESKEGWEDYIKKLKLNPNSTILDRLMISLDAMKDLVLKNIFIDIACFFNGRNINEAVKIMETCYPVNVDHNIRTLRKRSLLTINFKGELRMHDLLREMGWEVARNKCPG